MFLLVLSLFASAEFPITTAPGDQLYPDCCWDGEAFWVVWQDEELGTIRGVRVNEEGEFLTNEVELLPKANDGSGVRYPCVAAGGGRIGVECRVKFGYDNFGNEAWGIGHNEFDLDGNPLHNPTLFPANDYDYTIGSTPCLLFGKTHFYSIHRRSFLTPIDQHASSSAWGFDSLMHYYQVWQSSVPELELFPPVACWDGKRFVIIYHSWWKDAYLGVFLDDTLAQQGVGEDVTLGRSDLTIGTSGYPKYQSLTPSKSRYLLISEADDNYNQKTGLIWLDVLDSTCMPIKDSATLLDFNPEIKCWYPDAVSDGNDFIAVWENRFENDIVHLYAAEIDTLGNVLDSGYVVWRGRQPALAYGSEKYLLVWADGKGGDYDIRGMIFDTLEVLEGVEETKLPVLSSSIKVDKTVFTDRVELRLGGELMGSRTVVIYDASGRVVKRLRTEGDKVNWDASSAPPGVYFMRLEGKDYSQTVRIIKL